MSNLIINKTNNEANINPISYTNKDFRAIYEELLDIIENLTERWDPRATNESDPGLVLVKLKAFLADKLNYNIDKNTLENFPSQATQRGNAQKLYDILGYGMKYYQSATTKISMRYDKGDNIGINSNIETYTIPAFTQLTDDSNTVNFVTMSDVTIPIKENNQSKTECTIIEGFVNDFTINGNTVITIDNLDADYRLYFNETMIAQNGIFISNFNDEDTLWDQVDSLEADAIGTKRKIFKFGVTPNTNICYIEFPQDASILFENGIQIKYIVTKGVEGNIGANVLTSIANELIIDDIKEGESETNANLKLYTHIIQSESAVNGKNPENLKQAYRNCQKLINTFNTLVTVQDYQNALYNIDNPKVVSNCVVSDRTNDINYSYKVVNKNLDGTRALPLNTGKKDAITNKFIPDMNAFQIGIYGLIPVENITNATSYDRSFLTNATTIEEATDSIEEYKSIQHDYIETVPYNTVNNFIFKNLVSLEGKVITYKKVSKLEAEEIQDKIKTHLYKKYEAREVDFGRELNYDDLINNIKEADYRIKDVILELPEYQICVMRSDNSKENVELNIDLDGDEYSKYVMTTYHAYYLYNNVELKEFQITKNAWSTKKSLTTIDLDEGDFVKQADWNIINDDNNYILNHLDSKDIEIDKDLYFTLLQTINNNNIHYDLKEIIEINGITIPYLTRLQANIIAKSILSGATPYFIFNNNYNLNYSMKSVKKYTKSKYNESKGLIDEGDVSDKLITNDDSKIGDASTGVDGVAAITTSVKILNDHKLEDNEVVFCVGPSYVSKAQLSTCLYYAFLSNKNNGNNSNYYKLNYFEKKVDTNGQITNIPITHKEYDTGNSNPNYYFKEYEVSQDDYNILISEYNENTSTYSLLTKSPITIKANSYYKLQDNEYLVVAESIIEKNGLKYLDLSNPNNKKYWIYSKDDIKGDIICPTMNINSIHYTSGHPTSETLIAVTSSDNLGSSNTIEILGENKVQINENNKVIYAAWSMGNLNNTLFDINKDIYYLNDKNEYIDIDKNPNDVKKIQLKKLLQNNDVFVYTSEDKQGLMLLSSGTEISITLPKEKRNILTNQFKNNRGIYWSMDPLDITSISSDGLNSSIEWQEIPLNIPLCVAEKQIVILGKGTIVKMDEGEYLSNIPRSINNFTYEIDGVESTLPLIYDNTSDNSWKIFSRLDLITSSTQGQLLKENQYVNLYTAKTLSNGNLEYELKATLGPGQYITSNAVMVLNGGHLQNTAAIEEDGSFKRILEVYVSGIEGEDLNSKSSIISSSFNEKISSYNDSVGVGNDNLKIDGINVREYKNYIETSLKVSEAFLDTINDNKNDNFIELELSPQFQNSLIPILFSSDREDIKLNIEANGHTNEEDGIFSILDTLYNNNNPYIEGYQNTYLSYFRFNNYEKSTLNIDKITLKLYFTDYKKDTSKESNKTQDISLKITFFNPLKISKLNPLVSTPLADRYTDKGETVDSILKSLSTSQGTSINLFDYSYLIDEEDQILNPLDSESFFLSNHPFNRYTIPQLNTGKDIQGNPFIDIKVSKQSQQLK